MSRNNTRANAGKDSDALSDILNRLDNIGKDIGELKRGRQDDSACIKNLVTRISNMERLLKEKDEKIVALEKRVEDLEQYTRKEDVIITGLRIQRPYANVVQGDSKNEMDRQGVNSVEEQVLEVLGENGVYIKSDEVAACHTIGKASENGLQKAIIRFVSRKTKVRTMINAKKLKGSGIYINEHLTKRNADIAKAARDLRREGKINSTWIRDCKVFVKCNEGKVQILRDMADLAQF